MEKLNNMFTLAFKLGVAVGGAVLIFYGFRIGYVPQDISLENSLSLLYLAIIFGLFYLLLVTCLTALGFSILWVLFKPLLSYIKYRQAQDKDSKITFWLYATKKIFGAVTDIENIIYIIAMPPMACLAFLLILMFSFNDSKVILTLFISAIACGSLFHINQIKLTKSVSKEPKEQKSPMSFQYSILLLILFTPLLVGGISEKLIEETMRIVHMREYSMAVHIKKPYINQAIEYGLKGKSSSFGDEYCKFESITVLFKGVGRNIVINTIPTNVDKNLIVPLVIPKDYIFITPQKSSLESEQPCTINF